MAGPTASVLLKEYPSLEQIERVNSTIDLISSYHNGEDFWVDTTLPIGGTVEHGAGAPFGFSITDSAQNEDEATLDEMAALIGYRPKYDFVIFAMRNQKADHKILGELIYFFAQQFDSYIDFGGAIFSLDIMPKTARAKYDIFKTEWPTVEPYFQDMIKNLKGEIFTLEYITVNNRKWASHICDAEFIGNWLSSQHFRMVK